jgi:twitching motility protein PilJ
MGTPHSITNSLKGRIWIAAGGLAALNAVLGLGAYLAVSFIDASPSLSIFLTVFLLSCVTIVFGWWLSNDIAGPIEKVTLIARSLERSPSATLPRTTGSYETDEILVTLHRSGKQLQNLISIMDDVASGKTEAASMPLEASDKLSASFQKLVSKVTDSISAKKDLDELQAAVTAISNEVSGIRNGRLDLNIRSEQPQTKEIANTLRYLINRLATLTRQVHASTSECQRTAGEARTAIRSTIESLDERPGVLKLGEPDLELIGAKFEQLMGELNSAVKSAMALHEGFLADPANNTRNFDTSLEIKSKIGETAKKVQKLRDRSQIYTQIARSAQDLAKRSNLIALNSTLISNGTSVPNELITEELELLATRTEELRTQLLSANETLNSEIGDLENEFVSLTRSTPDVSRLVNTSLQLTRSLGSEIENINQIDDKLRSVLEERNAEAKGLKKLLIEMSDVSATSAMARETEACMQRLSGLVEGLKDSVSDLSFTSSQSIPSLASSPDAFATGYKTATDAGHISGEN